MPKPRVYVETTVPNFYYDFRPSEAVAVRRVATRRWWATAAERFELVTSSIVHDELSAGRGDAVVLRLGLLAGIPILRTSPVVQATVEAYVRHKLMPSSPSEDALHLALASHHKCHFIVTWNCRHLANPNKERHIRRINGHLGLAVPKLLTPLDLLKEVPDDG